MPKTLKLAGGALNQTPLDWEVNLRNIKNAIEVAKQNKVEILLLPELCITGYGCEDMFLSSWVWEKSVEKLLEIVEWTEGITVAVGLPLMHENKLRNTACLITDKKILGFWAKQFMALDGLHYEPRWFHPWPPGEVSEVEIEGRKYQIGDFVYHLPDGVVVGFEICEDAWRPQRPAYNHQKRGVNLILNPSASHFAFGKTRVREEVVAVTASEQFNCVYIYANLLGNEAGRIVFDGEVMIAQYGELVQKNNLLSFADIDVAMADVDIDGPIAKSSHPIEYDNQDKCEEFIVALCLALFDYCRKSRSNGFVLSLSGGADSSLCAVAVAEMVRRAVAELGVLGFTEKLHMAKRVDVVALEAMPQAEACKILVSKLLVCAYQSTGNSSDATFTSARELAFSIGAVFHDWSIDEEVKGYISKIEKSIGRELTWQTDDITLQNIQARVRAPAIWMLANINYSLLMATSNRSEASVGYATMDGDTAGSISPIAGVDKNFVREWLVWAEKNLGYTGLSYVNSLQPTAELRPAGSNQTDESDLMPYPVLQEIERAAFFERLCPVKVFEKLRGIEEDMLLKHHIKKFYTLWSRNQWKRERYAPSFHFDDYNIDPRSWLRFPILSGSFKTELEELDQYQPVN